MSRKFSCCPADRGCNSTTPRCTQRDHTPFGWGDHIRWQHERAFPGCIPDNGARYAEALRGANRRRRVAYQRWEDLRWSVRWQLMLMYGQLGLRYDDFSRLSVTSV